MHTQRQHAEFLVTHKQADDLFHRQSQPAGTAHHGCSRCHGVRAPSWTAPRDRATARFEVRTLKVATVAA
jgi:hypothetical protein